MGERASHVGCESTATTVAQMSSTAHPARPGTAPELLAVYDAEAMRLSDGTTIARAHGNKLERATLAGLLAACRARGVTQLWVHPNVAGSLAFDIASSPGTPARGKWDIQPDPALEYDRGWYVALEPGVYGRLALVFPGARHLSQRAPALAETHNGAELLAALLLLRAHLGVTYAYSPGSTGTYLLRHLHKRAASDRRFIPLDPAGELPPPAYHVPADTALSWVRPLTETERDRAYLHSYDGNGARLHASSSLPLGVGMAEHYDTAEELQRTRGIGASDRHKRPGYWRITLDVPAERALETALANERELLGLEGGAAQAQARAQAEAGATLPSLLRTAGAYAVPGARERDVWVTSPTLRLLAELGIPYTLHEAWVWLESHQLLQPWYKRVRDARRDLASKAQAGELGARVALSTIKSIYTKFYAWLAMRREGYDNPEDNPLYRPDITHAVIAAERANFLRAFLTLARGGVRPFAAYTDCVYIASNNPDPVGAIAETGLAISPTALGQWKVKDCAIPMAEALAAMDTPGNPYNLHALQEWLNVRHSHHPATTTTDTAETKTELELLSATPSHEE